MSKLQFSFAATHVVALLLFTITLHAQSNDSTPPQVSKSHVETIEIKLVNGRNGRPMAASYVNVWVGKERKAATVIPTDQNGIALFRDPPRKTQPQEGGDFSLRASVCARLAGMIAVNVTQVMVSSKRLDTGA